CTGAVPVRISLKLIVEGIVNSGEVVPLHVTGTSIGEPNAASFELMWMVALIPPDAVGLQNAFTVTPALGVTSAIDVGLTVIGPVGDTPRPPACRSRLPPFNSMNGTPIDIIPTGTSPKGIGFGPVIASVAPWPIASSGTDTMRSVVS